MVKVKQSDSYSMLNVDVAHARGYTNCCDAMVELARMEQEIGSIRDATRKMYGASRRIPRASEFEFVNSQWGKRLARCIWRCERNYRHPCIRPSAPVQ
eukprot:scaffold40883_cov50-Attheya_sp.AAC.4